MIDPPLYILVMLCSKVAICFSHFFWEWKDPGNKNSVLFTEVLRVEHWGRGNKSPSLCCLRFDKTSKWWAENRELQCTIEHTLLSPKFINGKIVLGSTKSKLFTMIKKTSHDIAAEQLFNLSLFLFLWCSSAHHFSISGLLDMLFLLLLLWFSFLFLNIQLRCHLFRVAFPDLLT